MTDVREPFGDYLFLLQLLIELAAQNEERCGALSFIDASLCICILSLPS